MMSGPVRTNACLLCLCTPAQTETGPTMHWRRASAIAAKDRRPAGPAAVFVIFHPARLTDCIDMAAAQRRSGLKTCSDTLATARGGKTAFFSSLLLAGLLGTWANGILGEQHLAAARPLPRRAAQNGMSAGACGCSPDAANMASSGRAPSPINHASDLPQGHQSPSNRNTAGCPPKDQVLSFMNSIYFGMLHGILSSASNLCPFSFGLLKMLFGAACRYRFM